MNLGQIIPTSENYPSDPGHIIPPPETTASSSSSILSMLYIILFLHQTTTSSQYNLSTNGCISSCSYIKPQLDRDLRHGACRCISSCSYIKPQLFSVDEKTGMVVYHPVPTSNHNGSSMDAIAEPLYIILFLHQTTTAH